MDADLLPWAKPARRRRRDHRLEGTCLALIAEVRPVARAASLALVPYALWVAFATALTWSIAARNR